MTHYTGGCLCGAVRIAIAAAPYRVGICHCLDCRKRQGALFNTFAVLTVHVVFHVRVSVRIRWQIFLPSARAGNSVVSTGTISAWEAT